MSTRYVWEKWNKASEKYYDYSTYNSGWVNQFANGTAYRYLSVVDDTDPYTQVKLSGRTDKEIEAEYLYNGGYDGTDPMVTSAGKVFKYHLVGSVRIWEYQGQIVERTRYKKGSTSYGNVSSGSSGAYPANSYSGNYWYVKKGSDIIDPTSVTYPTTIFKGQTVTVTVTPRPNTYGGTISYKYEYTTNGSTWQVANNKTTSTSVNITIPAGATTFQARVTAMDNTGFTSTTAVTGSQVPVYDIDPISVTYNEEDLSTGNQLMLSITPQNSGYTGTVIYTVETNTNNTGWTYITEQLSVNVPLTIPNDAVSWAVRVYAKQSSYVSNTYVYGNGHETGIAVKQGAGFNIVPDNKHLGYLGSPDLIQFYVSTDNNVNFTCVINVDGTTVLNAVMEPGLQLLTLDEEKWAALSSTDEHTITISATSNSKSITREYKFYKFVYDASTLPGLLDGVAEAIKVKQEVTKSFWGYRLPMEILKISGNDNYITAYIDVVVEYIEGMKVMAVSQSGEVYSKAASETGTTRLEVSEKGDYIVSAVVNEISSDVKKVSISAEGEVKAVSLSFIVVNVMTADNAVVPATLSGVTYSATAINGQARLYLPSEGNWKITASKGELSETQTVQVTDHTTYHVSIPLYDSVFENNSWSEIQEATQTGLASSYWQIGDQKEIILNGGVNDLNFNNETYYVYILGFNHNSIYEGHNSLHLAIGKSLPGKQVAFGPFPFQSGVRWEQHSFRTDVCTKFMALLPTELQSVISACPKYSNEVKTEDKIWIMSEIEVVGQAVHGSAQDENTQQQYDYYKNGNSTVRYLHSNSDVPCSWALRSYDSKSNGLCKIDESGNSTSFDLSTLCLVPCFTIT